MQKYIPGKGSNINIRQNGIRGKRALNGTNRYVL